MAVEQKVAIIPLANIRENVDALRGVDKESEEFLGLVDSVRIRGILNPISVREIGPDASGIKPVTADGLPVYALVDGLHRFNAAIAANLSTIPVTIVDLDETQTYEAQIMANVHKKETRPAEYARQIQRIMGFYPTRTVTEQAAQLGKPASWLKQILGLGQLTAEIQVLVNEGKINQANAFALSRLPQNEQPDWVERAMTTKTDEFVPTCQARITEVKAANREGRKVAPSTFTPVPHCRKFAEIKEESDNGGAKLVAAVTAKQITNPSEVVAFVLKWVTNMDEETLATKRAAWEASERKKKEDSEKRAKEKAEKKGKEAAEAAAKAKAAQEKELATVTA